jgi:hypothetical protein
MKNSVSYPHKYSQMADFSTVLLIVFDFNEKQKFPFQDSTGYRLGEARFIFNG